MKIRAGKEDEYAAYLARNSDGGYSQGILKYTEQWAVLMEQAIDQEQAQIDDIAQPLSQQADTEGITGFMFGAAVWALTTFWEYGEELGTWHNSKYMSRTWWPP